MKWIAALLMIVNATIYLWASGRNVSVEQVSISAKPDVNKEGMLLLSETQEGKQGEGSELEGSQVGEVKVLDVDQLPTAVLDAQEVKTVSLVATTAEEGSGDAGSETTAATDQKSAIVDPVVASQGNSEATGASSDQAGSYQASIDGLIERTDLICYRVGPFRDEAGWVSANEWMTVQQITYKAVRSESRELRAVRVYLGPFDSLAATEPVVSALKAKGLDHYAYLRGEGTARISLGYFTQEELAVKFIAHLLSQGIEANSLPEYRTLGPFDWMEASIKDNQRDMLLSRQWPGKGVSVIEVDCSEFSIPAQMGTSSQPG